MAVVVPLSLALSFDIAAGMGALGGLYGAVCGSFLAALLGGIPTLISEPTGAITASCRGEVLHSYHFFLITL